MGNRAVITTKEGWKDKEHNLGIYLHWNGGRDSVEAFLQYCKLKEYRTPETDNYGWASLATVITNFFGADGLSIGIDTVNRLDYDNFDNGTYIIEGWEIVDRKCFEYSEQNNYDMYEMLLDINNSMPTKARLQVEVIEQFKKKTKYFLYEDTEGLPSVSTEYSSLDELKKGFESEEIRNAKTFEEVSELIETMFPFLSVYKEEE